MKNPRIVIYVLLFFLLVSGCQKESEQASNPEDLDTTTNFFEMNVLESQKIPEIVGYLESFSKKELFAKSTQGSSGAIFNMESIVSILDTLGNKNYSMDFYFSNSKPNEFYNLVVGVDSIGQKTAPVVFKYTSDPNHMEKWVANDYAFGHFKGTVDLHKFTDFFDDNSFSKSDCPPEHDDNGDPIPCFRDNVGSGGSGGSGTGGGTGGGTSGGCSYNSYWSACGGSNQYSTHGSGSCGGNGNGAGWVLEVECPNGNNSTTYLFKNGNASECSGCDSGPSGGVSINNTSRAVRKLQYYLEESLSDTELLWLESHQTETQRLNRYLIDNGRSAETRTIAIRAMLTMMTGDYVVSIAPLVRYPLGSNYATTYPKLTEYLKNQLPTVADSQIIIQAIKKYTNMSAADIKKQLEWGEGPEIKIEQLGGNHYATYKKEEEPNTIYLDIDLVNSIENSTPGSKVADALSFFIGVTILHEFVHYGDYKYNGDSWLYPQEEGLLFENDVYGQSVWIENAEIIIKNN